MRLFFVAFVVVGFANAQLKSVSDWTPDHSNKGIVVERISGDSLVSTFLISIQKEVRTHLHELHSETIYVIDGEAQMRLGDKVFNIKAGDTIFIPRGTIHGVTVTSSNALRVISVQAPEFTGKDRVYVD